MANLIARAGNFLDGQQRFVVVKPGNNADPVPSDWSQLVFNSDWGELLPIYQMGQITPGNSTSWQTVSFSSLGYVPLLICAWKCTGWNSGHSDTLYFTNVWYSYAGSGTFTNEAAFRVKVYDGSFQYLFYLANDGSGHNFGPTGFTFAYAIIRSKAINADVVGDRSGTNWMRWTGAGPVIAKPGADVSSANPDDFLLNPAASLTNGTLAAAGQFPSTLPYYGLAGSPFYTNQYLYRATVAHNLGFIPFFVTTNSDGTPTSQPYGSTQLTYADVNNLYLDYYLSSSVGSSYTPPKTTGYAIFRQKWASS